MAHPRILLVSHSINVGGTTSVQLGPPLYLWEYLRERGASVVWIEHPDPVSEDLAPTMRFAEGGVEKASWRAGTLGFGWLRRLSRSGNLGYALFRVRDLLSTLWFVLRLHQRFDLYVGVESYRALPGFLFRALGLVDQVVYDVVDYSPDRMAGWLNSVFHYLDAFATRHADWSWVQTERTIAAREVRHPGLRRDRQVVKRSGVPAQYIRQLPAHEVKRHRLVYVGLLGPRDGVELLIEALPTVSLKVPDFDLIIVGYGVLENDLARRVWELGVQDHVSFLGMVGGRKYLEEILLHSAIGLAPYSDEPGSVKYYNDVDKPYLYLTYGMPQVITRIPMVSQDIESAGAGLVIEYDVRELADACVRLLTDDELFLFCRKNALNMAQERTWQSVFDCLLGEALSKT